MKNIYFFIIAILISLGNLFAQAPQKFNYQAVARDASGNLIANQNVNFRISILQASASGTAVYVETHAKTTNAFGQATLIIGGGTVVSGNFSSISWGNNAYYLKTEMDATGGTTFALMGTTQLLSVPYALYSNTAGSGGNTYTGGTAINVSGTTINNTAPDQIVILNGTGATTVSGTYPNFTINSTDNNTIYTAGNGINIAGNSISNTQPNATHSGDATGNSALTVVKLQGRDIATTAPANGQALKWNSITLKWEPATDNNTTYTGGTGINVSGTIINNTAPDQIVTLNGTGATTVSGTYPNFTINSTDNNTTYTSGTGINISGTTVNNTAPDQTVTITSGIGISATGTYPNFSIANTQSNATHTGDVTGDDTLTVVSLRGNPLSTNNPNTGQVLKWNGTEWDPSIMDVLPTGYMGQTLMYDATNWIATSNFYNDGNNIGINIFPAIDRLQIHNGNVSITNNNGLPGILKLYESSDDGQNFTAFKTQNQTGDITYTLPASSGNLGEVLTTNGMGELSWTSGGSILPVANMGQTLWNDGTSWLSGNLLYNNDTSIGIGTTTPTAQLHVNGLASGKGNVLFEGEYKLTPGNAPISGTGTRMMWYPDKAAFRAGHVSGTDWDTDSIGGYSVAMGYNTRAKGEFSTAMGIYTTALGEYSFAIGQSSIASGSNSIAMGIQNKASGNYSNAFGQNSEASGVNSTAMGFNLVASGNNSTAIGFNTVASGSSSTAIGSYNVASGSNSTAMGQGNTSSGMYSTSMGQSTTASGSNSTAMGYNTVASGYISTAFGAETDALGDASTALGYNTFSYGFTSTALGNKTLAKSYAETVIGCFNTDYSQNNSNIWDANDRLFVIGNGLSEYNRRNALTMLKNGNIGLGIENPTALLHTKGIGSGNCNVLFEGEMKLISYGFTPGPAPVNGIGTRMMWYPDKAAFRAGYVDGSNWDTDSIGYNSVAMGYNTKAVGDRSFAMGYNSMATKNYSTAIGYTSKASGEYSTAIGRNSTASGNNATALGSNTASGDVSVAMGYGTTASGNSSTAMGWFSTASGEYSTATGNVSTASGDRSTSFGDHSLASGNISTATGNNTRAYSYCETVIGSYNTDISWGSNNVWYSDDPLFVIGNGFSIYNRSNALTMLKNGCIGLQNVVNPTYALELPNNSINSFGKARAYAWDTYSDKRIKSKIKSLDYGIKEIMKLKPVSFFQHNSTQSEGKINISENGKNNIGFLAQEIYKIIPEIVNKPENENITLWSMSYEKLVPVLTKAMQEQQQMIENQNIRNDKLESVIDKQQKMIEELIKRLEKLENK